MPSGAAGLPCAGCEAGPVVDPFVEPQLVDEDAGLLRTAGTADHPGGAEQPGELASGAAHRAGRRGHEHHVAVVHLAGPAEPHIGGETGLAQDAEPGWQRGERRVDDGGGLGVHHGVIAPAEAVPHEVTDREPVGAAFDDPPDGRSIQRAADGEVGGVVLLGGLHPPAHGRIDAHVGVAHQQLAGTELADRLLFQREVRGCRAPVRARGHGDDPRCHRDGFDRHGHLLLQPSIRTLYCARPTRK
jgi:hypothetical protein